MQGTRHKAGQIELRLEEGEKVLELVFGPIAQVPHEDPLYEGFDEVFKLSEMKIDIRFRLLKEARQIIDKYALSPLLERDLLSRMSGFLRLYEDFPDGCMEVEEALMIAFRSRHRPLLMAALSYYRTMVKDDYLECDSRLQASWLYRTPTTWSMELVQELGLDAYHMFVNTMCTQEQVLLSPSTDPVYWDNVLVKMDNLSTRLWK